LPKKFKEDVNNQIKGLVERQLTKKRLNVLGIIIFSFFAFNLKKKKR